MSEDADLLLRRVGLRVSKHRRELGLTQRQFGERIAMNQSNIALIEQGLQNLTVRTLVKLAAELGMTVSELFAEDPREAG